MGYNLLSPRITSYFFGTPPKVKQLGPEKWCLEDDPFPLGFDIFSGTMTMLNFRVGIFHGIFGLTLQVDHLFPEFSV